jgi:hypothetical protein
MRRSISTTNEALHDEPVAAATAATVTAPEITNGADPMDGEPAHFLVTEDTPYRHHPHIETHNHAPTTVPAWQAATDTSQGYGDDGAPPAAAGGAGGVVGASAHTGPGLISHHPTTMESIPVVSRPVPHSLMSNSIYATEGVVGDAEEVEGEVVDENPMVRWVGRCMLHFGLLVGWLVWKFLAAGLWFESSSPICTNPNLYKHGDWRRRNHDADVSYDQGEKSAGYAAEVELRGGQKSNVRGMRCCSAMELNRGEVERGN